MPKWWPFGTKDEIDPEAAFRQEEAALRQEFETHLGNGAPRQMLLHRIEKASTRLEGEPQTAVIKAKLRAYDLLYSELRPRMLGNLTTGKEHEMAGRIEEAIAAYKTAVQDQVPTRFPYEHLRVIYYRQKRFDDAQAICQAALQNPYLSQTDHAHFDKWLARLDAIRS